MTVYSELLWQGNGGSGAQTVYTVAAGTTVVVRDVEVYNGSGGALEFHLQTVVSGFNGAYPCVINSIANGQGGQWQGRVVLPASSELILPPFGTGVQVVISGYVLDAMT